MSGFPRPRHAVAIALVELRRGWRKFRGKGRVQQGVVGVAVLFGLVATGVAALGANAAGQAVAAGEVSDVLRTARLVPSGVIVALTLLTVWTTVVQMGDVDGRDGLLTTVPHRDVAGGLYITSLGRSVGIFYPVFVAAALGFGAGVGSLATGALTVVALTAAVATAHGVGFAGGLGLKYLLSRSALVARYKLVIGALVFLAYMAAVVSNSLDDVFYPAVVAARESPVGWYADLALTGVVANASATRGVLALAGSLVAVVACVRAAVTFAGMRWYSDPVDTGERRHEGATTVAGESRLAPLLGQRAARVAEKRWLRARRAPLKLVFVVYPLFALVGPIQESIQSGEVSAVLPATIALYGAWAAGSAFTLNPLGDEGAVLPVTVTSGVGGRTYVRGLLAADLVPGLPLAVGAATVTAVLSPLGPTAVAATVLGTALLVPGAAALASGVGFAFPKFEASNVTRSRKVVVPSTWGFVVYSLSLLVLGSPATLLQIPFVTDAAAGVLGVGPVVVRTAGIALGAVLVATAGFYSYRHAVRSFDRYTL